MHATTVDNDDDCVVVTTRELWGRGRANENDMVKEFVSYKATIR